MPVARSDEAAHLADEEQDDIAGTTDYQSAVADGKSWNPPDSPTPEGLSGTDARPEDMGGQH
jgi:hypothetical protein